MIDEETVALKPAITYALLSVILSFSCKGKNPKDILPGSLGEKLRVEKHIPDFQTRVSTIHVFVALCDNKYQGIVPVPAKMGNGQDPDNNLYWGWGYGVRTYFRKSKEWKFIQSGKVDSMIPERLIFKHNSLNYYLVADAYDGRYIRNCTIDFLNSLSGNKIDSLHLKNERIGINGKAKLLALIGHNGLMDFQLPNLERNADHKKRDCIILACLSKKYFSTCLKAANANPVLWTSGLMGPEAYTLHDALSAYVQGGKNEVIRKKAAEAYSKYTKCSYRAAKNLLVTGW